MKSVTVVIVNYKNEALTIRFVKEELPKIDCPYYVVIVNNTSTKESDEALSVSMSAPIIYDLDNYHISEARCYIIHSNSNDGFASANNTGAIFNNKYLHSDYLLFTNNDIIILSDNNISRMIQKIETDNSVGLIGPKVKGPDGRLQSPEPFQSFYELMIYPYIKPFLFKKKEHSLSYAARAQEGYHYKVMGSFFMMNNEDFFRCGMMDSHTFLYFEESILTERLKIIGKKVYYFPAVEVYHAHSQTISKYSSFIKQRNYMFESGAYYFRHYIRTPRINVILAWMLKEISIIVGTIKRMF